jgi:UDP-N-acetylmuramyl tripeptide synthase
MAYVRYENNQKVVMNMGIRSVVATYAGRIVRWAMHDVLRRSASQLPGRVALFFDPHVLANLARKPTSGTVVVCGTNGKTTTTNVLADAFEAQGKRVLCNRDGANMLPGVVAALLPKRSADWAIIEADELSTIHILPKLRPTYLVLLNLFRDQLDRAGEIDHVQDTLVHALESSPSTTLVTCGDDPLCMGVARRASRLGTRVLTFGITQDLDLPQDRVPEARFCQSCGAELVYAYRTYAQLGSYSCPACDFARPALDFAAHGIEVDVNGVAFTATQTSDQTSWHIRAGFGGIYMVYNLLAASTIARIAQVGEGNFQHALATFDPKNGRLQHFEVDGREVILNLAKNPTGLNQNLALLLSDTRTKALHVVINDNPNDGRDVSWIWDVDFERLTAHEDVLSVTAGGHRANDLQVRLKYAGISAALAASVAEALAQVRDLPTTVPLYVLTNYSALQPTKDELLAKGRRHA